MKTRKVLITAEIVTNINLTSTDVIDALQKMCYIHGEFDADETVAHIPIVKLTFQEAK